MNGICNCLNTNKCMNSICFSNSCQHAWGCWSLFVISDCSFLYFPVFQRILLKLKWNPSLTPEKLFNLHHPVIPVLHLLLQDPLDCLFGLPVDTIAPLSGLRSLPERRAPPPGPPAHLDGPQTPLAWFGLQGLILSESNRGSPTPWKSMLKDSWQSVYMCLCI